MSKQGLGFTAANGTKLPNYGSKRLTGVTDEDDPFKMCVNVTIAQKSRASFPKMVKEDNDIFYKKRAVGSETMLIIKRFL